MELEQAGSMNTEQVIEKILSDAGAQADGIKVEAHQKAESLDQELKEWLGKFGQKTETIAQKAAKDARTHVLAAARMQMSKDHLAAKGALLASVFDRMRGQVQQLGDDAYQKLMAELMVKAVETGDEEVVVGRNETRINDKFIKEVNRRLGPGYKGNLRLARDQADIEGGFILRRGKVQINVSIDVLVAQAREELEMEIATTLFGE